ncbi:MAG: ATP-binding cassette domain-containing protein [Rubrivivax sp.]|nr:ATP-binding cassette domain-containing protein [Rubrivivax sp.]
MSAALTSPAATVSAGLAAPLVALRQAGLVLGGQRVLHDINLELRPAERLALVGPNGSGKTSLLRLLHGLLPCSSGERQVLGGGPQGGTHPRSRVAPPRMAMVFQKPFVLSFSTQANVRLALWLQGLPASERADRCAQALDKVGLSPQAHQRATTLSGGQQQRLALARAWALQPDVLLLDEPTAALDPSAKREVEALMETLADEGLTLVFSSHNLGQVKRLATRVAYLESGRVAVDAPVEAFFAAARPNLATPFLKGELSWR